LVFAEHGALRLRKVQPEGKKVMDAKDWLRGMHHNDDVRFDTIVIPERQNTERSSVQSEDLPRATKGER